MSSAITNSSTGTLTINGGGSLITSSTNWAILNYGTISTSSVTISASSAASHYLIVTHGTFTVNAGTNITNNYGYGIAAYGGRVNYSAGTMSTYGNAIVTGFASDTSSASIVISGGTITSTSASPLSIAPASYNTSVSISNGVLSGNHGIWIGGSKSVNVTISGGSISGSVNNGITLNSASASATFNITGGFIKGAVHGIYLYAGSATLTLGTNNTTVLSTPTIVSTGSNKFAINTSSSGTFTFNWYDGYLYGTNSTREYQSVNATPSGYAPVTVADTSQSGYTYRSYLTKYTATFYYNSNSTNGQFVSSSTTVSCGPTDGTSCTVTVPTVVRNSVGKYNSSYKGVANGVNKMSIESTISLTGDATYYAVYSSPLMIYYPNTSSSISSTATALYRNEYFTNVNTMNTITSNASNSTVQATTVSLNNLKGTISSLTTSYNTTSGYAADNSNIINSNVTTYYALSYSTITATFYYHNGTGQTSTTGSANQFYYCKNTTAINTYNENITIPSVVSSSTGTANGTYLGVSDTTNSVTKTTPNTGTTRYYAIYKSTYTASFEKGSGVSGIGSTVLTCDSNYTTNGTSYSGSNCQITLPAITVSNGYNDPRWYDSSNNEVGTPGNTVNITGNVTYTAKAKVKRLFNKISAVNDSNYYYISSKTKSYYGPSVFYLKANDSGSYDLWRHIFTVGNVIWVSGLGEDSQISAAVFSNTNLIDVFYTKPNNTNTGYDLYVAYDSASTIVSNFIDENVMNISAVYNENDGNMYVYYVKQNNSGSYDLWQFNGISSGIIANGVSSNGQISATYDSAKNPPKYTYVYYVKQNTSGSYDLWQYCNGINSIVANGVDETGAISTLSDPSYYFKNYNTISYYGHFAFFLTLSASNGYDLLEFYRGGGSVVSISTGVDKIGAISAVYDNSSVGGVAGRYIYYSKLNDTGTGYSLQYYCSSCSCNTGYSTTCGSGTGTLVEGISENNAISAVYNDAGIGSSGRFIYYLTLNSMGTQYDLHYYCSSCNCSSLGSIPTCGSSSGIIAEDVY